MQHSFTKFRESGRMMEEKLRYHYQYHHNCLPPPLHEVGGGRTSENSVTPSFMIIEISWLFGMYLFSPMFSRIINLSNLCMHTFTLHGTSECIYIIVHARTETFLSYPLTLLVVFVFFHSRVPIPNC